MDINIGTKFKVESVFNGDYRVVRNFTVIDIVFDKSTRFLEDFRTSVIYREANGYKHKTSMITIIDSFKNGKLLT